MRKINEKPFELVGTSYQEYKKWCDENSKKEKDPKTKQEFFKLIYDFKLIVKNGKIVDVNKEEN